MQKTRPWPSVPITFTDVEMTRLYSDPLTQRKGSTQTSYFVHISEPRVILPSGLQLSNKKLRFNIIRSLNHHTENL